MKRQIRTLVLLLLVTSTSFFCKKSDTANMDCIEYPIPIGSYAYPILPGTTAWINLGSTTARVKACQISDSVLVKMSTAAVIQSWIDFPFNSDIVASSSLQSGIQYWLANFSGLIELQRRADAELALLERYKTLKPQCITSHQTDTGKGNFSLSILYTEILLAQDTLIKNTNIDDKRNLVSEAIKKYNVKLQNSSYYDQLSYGASLFVCAKVMRISNYLPFISALNSSTVLSQFINTGIFPLGITNAHPDIQKLIQLSSNYLN